jgi:DNA-binding NarL/FixJ family response regulator
MTLRVVKHSRPIDVNGTQLSPRELEVIELVCMGLKNREIAEVLFLSKRTIEGHRKRISDKTETNNVAELVVYAIKHKIYIIE